MGELTVKERYTPEQRAQLLQNPNVLRVGNHVSYSPQFKLAAVRAYLNDKKTPEQIFLDAGFDVDIIGRSNARTNLINWRRIYRRFGEAGLLKDRMGDRSDDTVDLAAGKASEAQLRRLAAEIKFLKRENEFLKKVSSIEGSVVDKPTTKYELIHDLLLCEGRDSGCTVESLCEIAGVSRSGYYRWLKAEQARIDKQLEDVALYLVIREIFERGKRKLGFRRIKMILERQYGITVNHKKIRRIMKEFDLVAEIRQPNHRKLFYTAAHEHRTAPYRLNREFFQTTPYRVFCTDITYLRDATGQWHYLSVLLDIATGEISSYHLSTRMTLDLSLALVDKAVAQLGKDVLQGAMINSDQGIHFANRHYATKLTELGIVQSMSRKGNCTDNAPVESFFGHMKDELDLCQCQTTADIQDAVDSYMHYHNHERYQWTRNKMAPVEYRQHLLAA